VLRSVTKLWVSLCVFRAPASSARHKARGVGGEGSSVVLGANGGQLSQTAALLTLRPLAPTPGVFDLSHLPLRGGPRQTAFTVFPYVAGVLGWRGARRRRHRRGGTAVNTHTRQSVDKKAIRMLYRLLLLIVSCLSLPRARNRSNSGSQCRRHWPNC
jgi:hypothetical protein